MPRSTIDFDTVRKIGLVLPDVEESTHTAHPRSKFGERKSASGNHSVMSERDFGEVQQALEETVSKLKRTTDAALRQELLREMRRLLAQADTILQSRP